jgi:SAM-dependent methyltransferase
MDSERLRLRKLRLLVGIASYGGKNLGFLKKVIHDYHSLPMSVDVVVFSNDEKDLGSKVRVIVGLPASNPWSLTFAHKPVFAELVDCYDLFIYSEDDIAVTEEHLLSFLRVMPGLNPDEIPGFLRYEVNESGRHSFPDVHGSFHWEPESVRKRGKYTVAEFTNDHAGFYLLTQDQLKRAIASGGFLRSPCEGRYDMAVTAATDPYTCCGFKKVICISHLEEFLLHHLSNRYANTMGIPLAEVKKQIRALNEISEERLPKASLCHCESKLVYKEWYKSYYERANDEVLALVPSEAKSVLSIGCGWGETELVIKSRGANVTALPLDSVIGARVAEQGIELIYGRLEQSIATLGERKFDCVFISNLLHLQRDPAKLLAQCSGLAAERGTVVVTGPNFGSLATWRRRFMNPRNYRKLRSFEESGITRCTPGFVLRQFENAGLHRIALRWFDHLPLRIGNSETPIELGWLTGREWVVSAIRMGTAQ